MAAASPQTSESPRLPLLCLDVGMRRIGVAVCDRLGLTSRGLTCLRRDSGWTEQVLELVREYECGGIIVGLAKNMDGSEGEQAGDCRAAAAQLQAKSPVPVALWDERLSTWTASERLRDRGLSGEKLARRLDQTAAAVILEDYLAGHRG